MENKDKKLTFKWLEKLKKIKHIEIYIAVIFVAVLLLIYFSNSTNNSTGKLNTTSNNELNVTAYVDNLETSLEESLSNIGGVSNVKVMITLNMQQAEVNESNIILNSFPEIKGVLVTAKGVDDTLIKLKVLHAIQAVIDVTNGNIEILSSE